MTETIHHLVVAEILQFWFGNIVGGWTEEDRFSLWFGSQPDDDETMRSRFEPYISQAVAGELHAWEDARDSNMALVLLTDQMTRATRRGTAAAFGGDEVARGVVLRGLARGLDKELSPPERLFYYLPLEHSEDLSHQEQSLQLYKKLSEDLDNTQERTKGMMAEAQKHYDMIARFGRFPHRNALLGRENTAEEEAYLKEHGGSYGQAPRESS